jgi:Tfp pilus assembly protein PilN
VKYQVNLYPERLQRAAVVRKGILRGSVLGIVVGVDLLLIGFLVISGFQVRGRVSDLRESIALLESRTREAPETSGGRIARQLVQTRLNRVDWATTLDAVARALPNDLILTKIDTGTGRGRGNLDGVNLEGSVLGGSRDLTSVMVFMKALRESPLVARQYPSVDLGTASGVGLQDFGVVLRKATPKAAPSTGSTP